MFAKIQTPVFIYAIIVIFVALSFIFIGQNKENNFIPFATSSAPIVAAIQKIQSPADCVSKTEERIIRGDSISGIAENGQTVRILFDYYKCHEVQKGDIVILNFAGRPEPLIKIVKAVPGDSFKLAVASSSGVWNIFINGEMAKNSLGQAYAFNQKGYQMLSLYANDYYGVIPANAYLVLGNAANGSLDSSRFGLISKSEIVGKAY